MNFKIRIAKTINRWIQLILLCFFIMAHNTWIYALFDMKFRGLFLVISCIIMYIKPNTREHGLLTLSIFILFVTFFCELIFWGLGNMKIALYNYLFLIEPILLTIVCYKYDEYNFCDRFVKISLLLAIISLLFYFISFIDIDFLINSGILKKVELNRLFYTNFYCNFLYVLRDREISRNVGLFCEPGLYQIILNSAIYLLIFYKERVFIKHRKVSIMLLLITLFTTQSATGIIGFMIIISAVLISDRKIVKEQTKILAGILIFFVLVVVFIDFHDNTKDSLIYTVVFEKLINIRSQSVTTGSVRFSMIRSMLHLITVNPLGYGFSYISEYCKNYIPESVGARILFTTAAIGVLPIITLIYHFIQKCYQNRKSNLQFWTVILVYINTSLAQSREFYPALLVLMILCRESHFKKLASRGLSYDKKNFQYI